MKLSPYSLVVLLQSQQKVPNTISATSGEIIKDGEKKVVKNIKYSAVRTLKCLCLLIIARVTPRVKRRKDKTDFVPCFGHL